MKKDLKTTVMFATSSELYDQLLNTYTTQHDKLTKNEKRRINSK